MQFRNFAPVASVAFVLTCQFTAAHAQQSQTVRVRGTIESVSGNSMALKTRAGQAMTLALAPALVVNETYPVNLSDIGENSFVGVASLPQPDGTLKALAVTVFPEAMRGTGEGHRAFDLLPESTMTNATVTGVATAPSGRQMKLRYTGGEKVVDIPQGTPVVSFRPADRSLLVPGASVSVTVRDVGGVPTAERMNAGRNGFVLPY